MVMRRSVWLLAGCLPSLLVACDGIFGVGPHGLAPSDAAVSTGDAPEDATPPGPDGSVLPDGASVEASANEASAPDASTADGGSLDGSGSTDGAARDGSDASDACAPVAAGHALSFDASTQPQYVVVPDSTLLHVTGTMTIEAWVSSGATSGCIVCKPYGTATLDSFATWISGDLSWGFPTSTGPFFGSPWTATIATWHHVAASVDRNTLDLELFLDGTLLTSAANNGGTVAYDGNPLVIGSDNNNGAFDVGFDGVIDEVRIFNTARTASQIASDATSQCSPVGDPTLVAYYPFNEGSGTTAHDATAHHLDGALGGSGGAGASPTWVKSAVPF
jgi:hypothetical protein